MWCTCVEFVCVIKRIFLWFVCVPVGWCVCVFVSVCVGRFAYARMQVCGLCGFVEYL